VPDGQVEPASTGPGPDTTDERIRWSWVIVCVIAGAALIAFALVHWWAASSVVTNVGTGFLLAAVLFFLERRFTHRVVTANRQAVEAAEGRLQQQADRLATRIDGLQAQIEERMQETSRDEDRALAAVREDVSRENILGAFGVANSLNAIHWGAVTVPGAADPDGFTVTFSAMMQNVGGFGPPEGVVGPILRVEVRALHDPSLETIPLPTGAEWRLGVDPAEVAATVNRMLQQGGMWRGPGTVDWTLAMSNLADALDLAVRSRRDGAAGSGWRLGAELFELVGRDWALTGAGVEHRDHGLVVAETMFPDREYTPDGWPPKVPDWADPAEWQRVLVAGQRVFPIDHGPFRRAPALVPWRRFGPRPSR
jgi:hypothetical protein